MVLVLILLVILLFRFPSLTLTFPSIADPHSFPTPPFPPTVDTDVVTVCRTIFKEVHNQVGVALLPSYSLWILAHLISILISLNDVNNETFNIIIHVHV